MKLRLYGILLICLPFVGFAQFEYLPLSNDFEMRYTNELFKKDNDFHSSVKPFRRSEVFRTIDVDSLNEKLYYESKFAGTWFGGALFNKHFVEVRTEEFDLSLDPLVNFNVGRERNGNADYTYVNTRGIYAEGRIGKQVTFMTSFAENQARFPGYVSRFVDTLGIVPGQGKARDFKTDAYDFQNAFGIVSFTPSKYFNFSLGQGKHFFGEGFRSMFIGDAAFNYPFFKIETTVWRVKYVNLWTEQRDIRKSVEVNEVHRKKWTSMHYLSYNVNSRLNLNLFEAVIYRSDTNNRGLEASYFNPIILFRPIEFANGSKPANVVIGIGASYKLFNDVQIYTQFSLDEFVKAEIVSEPGSWRNKYSGQLGVKYFNAFKVQRLNLLLEYNAVRPYMYAHERALTNHGHYNQPMAHLWQANFHEVVFRANYSYHRWIVQFHLNAGVVGNDTSSSNWGRNIYRSYNGRELDDNNKIAQGVRTTVIFADGQLAYLVNPSYNMRIEGGITIRTESPEINYGTLRENNTVLIYFGLRTGLFNNYYDF